MTLPCALRDLAPSVDGFRVPAHLHFHPGHAWARVDDEDLVTLGMDDFAHKLLGRTATIKLPEVGSRLRQGERAWVFVADSREVDMLSPVAGTVVAANIRAAVEPRRYNRDPYDDGWLLRVQVPRLTANVTNLFSGKMAEWWMEMVSEDFRARLSPDLGQVDQDGGVPIEGMAHSLDPDHWDELARAFFLT